MDVNFTISIPDAQADRVTAAMRAHYGQIEDGVDENNNPVFRDRTGAEIIESLQTETRQRIIDIVRSIENQAAARAAISGVANIDAT